MKINKVFSINVNVQSLIDLWNECMIINTLNKT